MKGWHFLKADKRLGYGDGRVVKPGVTLKLKPGVRPVLCESGFHASRRPLDALQYAPGPVVCRVELGGDIIHGDDKSVATERTVIWMADATRTLHLFALRAAGEVLHLAGPAIHCRAEVE